MGAMENKSLNIFNSSAILADPKTETDANFENIEGIVAHEYFHNWTGNRVTCRDWFQLTLKEGLTVFRDQEFSGDMNSRAVRRIKNVHNLIEAQFPQDAGPQAHPIRPESFIEINNFYTATVYQKGAEVIRMVETLIGKENFRRGITRYFELFDGQAVTCEDFIRAMQEVSGFDFSQFMNWYHQAGTPRLKVSGHYNEKEKTYTLSLEQSCPKTPESEHKKPFLFPLVMGLLDSRGQAIAFSTNEDQAVKDEQVLIISEKKQTFIFKNISEKPLPSLNRRFSAPIILENDLIHEEKSFLFHHDPDLFNRYENGQELAFDCLKKLIHDIQNQSQFEIDPAFSKAVGKLMEEMDTDPAFKALALSFPSENQLIEKMSICDFETVHKAKMFFSKALAKEHEELFLKNYRNLQEKGPFRINAEAFGKRHLKNLCLAYLVKLDNQKVWELAREQYTRADNMTDELAALVALCHSSCPDKEEILENFHLKWKDERLVMNKWLAVQAASPEKNLLERIKKLEKHPVYAPQNPNTLRALLGGFAGNLIHFHAPDGSGYRFMARRILEIDTFNSLLAGRMANVFSKFPKLDAARKELMRSELEKILAKDKLSKDVYEIVSKTLSAGDKRLVGKTEA
jgi:aminopeptidase N